MATKPSSEPTWDSGGTNVVEPTTEKTSGWASGGVVVSSYFNWWMKLVHDWVKYLKDGVFVGESGQPGVTAIGVGNSAVVGTVASGTNVDGASFTGRGTGAGLVGTGGSGGGFGVTGVGIGTAAGLRAVAGSGTTVAVSSNANLKFTGSNPTASTAFANELTPMLAPKSWATIELNGTASPTVSAGANVGTVSISTSIVSVAFPAGGEMANGNYSVQLMLDDDGGTSLYHPRVVLTQTTGFTFRIRDASGTVIDPASVLSGMRIFAHVLGAQ